MAEAQKARHLGTAFPPDFLLIAVMSMATAWSVASPFAPPLDPNAAGRIAAERKNLIEAVRLLAGSDKASRPENKSKSR